MREAVEIMRKIREVQSQEDSLFMQGLWAHGEEAETSVVKLRDLYETRQKLEDELLKS